MSDDWDKPTIIGYGRTRSGVAKGADLNAAQRSGNVAGTNKIAAGQKTGAANHGHIAKLDRDDAPKAPPKVDAAVGKALAQARAAKTKPDGKGMTQKDLATAVNAKPSDIADIESGKATPSPELNTLLGKLERILGVKLRGAASAIGTELHPAKGAKK